ncbi:MAG: hypothetical protein K2I43_04435, partial [Alistipes sp.]|nr:hypothetical protein [Alistipes sp.]
MKNILRNSVLLTAALTAFAACSDSDTPNPGPVIEPPAEMYFTSASDAVYRAGSDKALYELKLTNDDNELFLAFEADLFDGAGDPMPADGEYDVTADSYWLSSKDGVEVRRKLASGSVAFAATQAGCKLGGTVAGSDKTELRFSFEGPVKFADNNGEPEPDALKCLGAYGTYYGSYYIPQAADWFIRIFDTEHKNQGDPYTYIIDLDFTSTRPAGAPLMPAMGTYRIDSEGLFAEGTMVGGMMNGTCGSFWRVRNGDTTTAYIVTDGFFTLRRADNGKYQIFGTLKDNWGQELSFSYEGSLSFNNDAVGTFTAFTTDYDMGEAYYANQKCYDTSEEGNFWKIYLYDEASWTTKGQAGYFITFDIPLTTDCKSIPAGEYTAAAHVLKPELGNFIPGYMFAYDQSIATA